MFIIESTKNFFPRFSTQPNNFNTLTPIKKILKIIKSNDVSNI